MGVVDRAEFLPCPRLSAWAACSWNAARSPRASGSGRRKRLKRDRGTVKLAIEVPAQILGDLQGPAFNFSLLEAGHAVEGKDGDCEQRQSQRQGEQASNVRMRWGGTRLLNRRAGMGWMKAAGIPRLG